VFEIGEIGWWRGRRWWLRGFTPMSQPERLAELQRIDGGDWSRAPLGEIEHDPDQRGGSLHRLRPRSQERR
jgi:hypothetical protein